MKRINSIFRTTPRNAIYASIVLLAGISLTIIISYYTQNIVRKSEISDFNSVCSDIQTKIHERLVAQAQLLRCGAALFAASDSVTRQDWKNFCRESNIDKNLPGIQALGFSFIIPRDELKNHVARIRLEGFPNYKITPQFVREIYTSIIYIEPFTGRNLRAFGYDMYSEPVRRRAMELARDSDMTVLSGKVTLIQETGVDLQAGSLMYVPVYRKNMPLNTVENRRAAIIGWVYSALRMNDLMNKVLGRQDLMVAGRIRIQVYDGEDVSRESLLFESQSESSVNKRIIHSLKQDLIYHEHKWQLVFQQAETKYALIENRVLIVIIGGIVISLLLFILFLSLFNTRHRAEKIAEELTFELKAEKERFQALLNSAAEAIYGTDNNGLCTFSNNACLSILGYTRDDQVIGKNMHMLTHHSYPDGRKYEETNCELFKALKQESGFHSDKFFLWKSYGTMFPAEIWSHPLIINGQVVGAVVTFLDITDRRKAEAELIHARNDAEAANKAKSEFLLNISHEFRTPLNAVIGYADLLEKAEGENRKEYSESVKSSGRRLLEMVEDILDYIRAEKDETEPLNDLVETSGLVDEIKLHFADKAAEKGLEFTCSIEDKVPGIILIDRSRLKKIISNLIDNAIKYTDKGKVSLNLSGLQNRDRQDTVDLKIEVSDTGKGIPEEFRKRLFEVFSQAGEKTILNGVGIGLALTQRLVKKLNGSIMVKSEPGNGSCFTVIIPGVYFKEKAKTRTAPIEEIVESKADKINAGPIHDLSGLLKELEGEYLEAIKNFEIRQPIGEIRKFGQSVAGLGDRHNCSLISDYGKQLQDAATGFDIDNLLKLIGKYRGIIESLKNIT